MGPMRWIGRRPCAAADDTGSGDKRPGGTSEVRRIVVLEATGAPDGTTRYVDQVVTYAGPDVEFKFLSLRTLLGMRYDVLHVHWPEVLVRGRSRLETWTRCAGFVVLLGLLRLRKVAIVRTLHNVEPHEAGGRVERTTLALLDRVTDHVVTINPTIEPVCGGWTYIPHGHYRDRFAPYERPAPVPGRLLYAGLIRPYKNVERLIEVFDDLDDGELSLRIVGKPTEALRERIESAALRNPRISHRLAFVPDDELVAEMAQAELVCLPYDDLFNSGILLVALSLDRPVLVPDTPATRALAEEVGDGWIHRFDRGLKADDVQRALVDVRTTGRSTRPRLDNRDWHRVARLYGDAFSTALATRRGARPLR